MDAETGERERKLASIAAFYLARGSLSSAAIAADMLYLTSAARPATPQEVSVAAIERYRLRPDFNELVEVHASALNPQLAAAEIGRSHGLKEISDRVAALMLAIIQMELNRIAIQPPPLGRSAQNAHARLLASLSKSLSNVVVASGAHTLRADTANQANAAQQASSRIKAAEVAAKTTKARTLLGMRGVIKDLTPRALELVAGGVDPGEAFWQAAHEKADLTFEERET